MPEPTPAPAAPAAPASAAAPAATPTPAPAAPAPAPTLLSGGPPADDSAPAPNAAPDWRAAYAGDDKDAAKRVGRFATEADFFKSYRELENKVRSGDLLKLPGEDAQPEEIAEFRKRLGIPEKAEQYGIAFPEGYQVKEADTAVLGGFTEAAHALNLRPEQAKGLFDWYMRQGTENASATAEAAHELKVQAVADLRNEYKGNEYRRFFGVPGKSAGLVGEYIADTLGWSAEELDEIANVRLPNGLSLGDWPPFLKGLARAAASVADDDALIGGDGAGGGKSIDEEKKELLAKGFKGRSQQESDRLLQLMGSGQRRDTRGKFAA